MNEIAEARGQLDLFAGGDPAGLRVVLPLPLRVRAQVATVDEEVFRARWLLPGEPKGETAVPFDALLPAEGHPEYASVRARFQSLPGGGLAARILGGIAILGRERKAVFDRAATVDVEGDLPADPALGFDAALEVASLKAILRAYGADLADREVARLALRVERLIAGGEGDFPSRLVATSAPPDSVVPVRGEEAGEAVPLPNGVAFLLLATKNLSPLREERAPDSRSGSTQAASFLEALRRLGGTATPEGLRVLGSALREALPADAEGEATRLLRPDRLGPERGVFGAAAIRGSGSLLVLVDSRGESAVRDLLAGPPGLRLVCRVGKVPG
ncbi:MAG: hypothetical protein L0323_09105 [Planctomycetes bacterium]|nr:hypothetical protein [Planctomycetota bacterium]